MGGGWYWKEKKKTGKKPRVFTFMLQPCEDAGIKSVSHPPQASLLDSHFLFLFVFEEKAGPHKPITLTFGSYFSNLEYHIQPPLRARVQKPIDHTSFVK